MARTSQLQIRISPQEKVTLKRLAGLTGQSVSAYVLSRALPTTPRALDASLDGLRAGTVSQGEALGALRRLVEGLAPDEVAEALADARVADLPRVTQNYLAALAEQLALVAGTPAPAWAASVAPLERPHFRWPLQSLRPYQLRASPLALKRRNIFDATETQNPTPAAPLVAASPEASRLHLLSQYLTTSELDVEFYFIGGAVLRQTLPAATSSARPARLFRVPGAAADPAAELGRARGWPESWAEEMARRLLAPGGPAGCYIELPRVRVFTPPLAYAFAVKLAARSPDDPRVRDDFRFLLRLLDLTSTDRALAVVGQYFSPRQLPQDTAAVLEALLVS